MKKICLLLIVLALATAYAAVNDLIFYRVGSDGLPKKVELAASTNSVIGTGSTGLIETTAKSYFLNTNSAIPLTNLTNGLSTWGGSTNVRTLGAVTNGSVPWNLLTGTPATLAGYGITNAATFAQGALAESALQPTGNGGSLTNLSKSQVGLGNVDNTSDANKPVSTAQQTALDAKAAAPALVNNIATVDWSAGSLFTGTLTNNTTVAFSNVVTAKEITLSITGASSFGINWPSGITWLGGTPANPAAGVEKRYTFWATSGSTYLGYSYLNRSAVETVAGKWGFTGTTTLNVLTATNAVISTLTVNDSNPTAPNLSTLSGATTMANRQAGDARWSANRLIFTANQLVNSDYYNAVSSLSGAAGIPSDNTSNLNFTGSATRTVQIPIPLDWEGTSRVVRILCTKVSGTTSGPAIVLQIRELGLNGGVTFTGTTSSGTGSVAGSGGTIYTSTASFPSGTGSSWFWFSQTYTGLTNARTARTLSISRLGADAGDTLGSATLFVPYIVVERLAY